MSTVPKQILAFVIVSSLGSAAINAQKSDPSSKLTSRVTTILERLAEFEKKETFKAEVKIEVIQKGKERVIAARRAEVLKALNVEAKREARDGNLDSAVAIKETMSKLEDGVLELPAKTDSERIARELRKNWRPRCWVSPHWGERRWDVMTMEEVNAGVRVTNTSNIHDAVKLTMSKKFTLKDEFEMTIVMSGKSCEITLVRGDFKDGGLGVGKKDVSTPTEFKVRCKDGDLTFSIGGHPATPSSYHFDAKTVGEFRVGTIIRNRGNILIHDLKFERLKG